jgi:hypothetical protein
MWKESTMTLIQVLSWHLTEQTEEKCDNEMCGQFHALAKTQYLLYRRLDEPWGQSGKVKKISQEPGSNPGPPSPQQVAIPNTQSWLPTEPQFFA